MHFYIILIVTMFSVGISYISTSCMVFSQRFCINDEPNYENKFCAKSIDLDHLGMTRRLTRQTIFASCGFPVSEIIILYFNLPEADCVGPDDLGRYSTP